MQKRSFILRFGKVLSNINNALKHKKEEGKEKLTMITVSNVPNYQCLSKSLELYSQCLTFHHIFVPLFLSPILLFYFSLKFPSIPEVLLLLLNFSSIPQVLHYICSSFPPSLPSSPLGFPHSQYSSLE